MTSQPPKKSKEVFPWQVDNEAQATQKLKESEVKEETPENTSNWNLRKELEEQEPDAAERKEYEQKLQEKVGAEFKKAHAEEGLDEEDSDATKDKKDLQLHQMSKEDFEKALAEKLAKRQWLCEWRFWDTVRQIGPERLSPCLKCGY